MGRTARQRAYRKVREAKKIVQLALDSDHFVFGPTGARGLNEQIDALLAGQYPCRARVQVVEVRSNGLITADVWLEPILDPPARTKLLVGRYDGGPE